MSKIRVGVLRGGMGGEYDVSLKTGAYVILNLPKEKYVPIDIFVGKDGAWHTRGEVRQPDEIAQMVDVVWNALHGEYGEDGKVQQTLEAHKIPYTGSQIIASAVGMNKTLAKEAVKKAGIKIPYQRFITREEYETTNPLDLFRAVFMPVVIKPPAGGSSLGISFAQTSEELWEGIKEAFDYADEIILEQHILGREATVGVVEGFRGRKYYTLMPIEIERKNKNHVWGYEEKYSGNTPLHCPGRFSDEEKKELERLTVLAHEAIGARHYSRSDFIISPRGIYFLEINTLPGLTATSLVPMALNSAGAKMSEFLDHVISLALKP